MLRMRYMSKRPNRLIGAQGGRLRRACHAWLVCKGQWRTSKREHVRSSSGTMAGRSMNKRRMKKPHGASRRRDHLHTRPQG